MHPVPPVKLFLFPTFILLLSNQNDEKDNRILPLDILKIIQFSVYNMENIAHEEGR